MGKRLTSLAMWTCILFAADGDEKLQEQRSCTVYVLLEKQEQESVSWKLTATSEMFIHDVNGAYKPERLVDTTITVTASNAGLMINGKQLVLKNIRIDSKAPISVGENAYSGALYILWNQGTYYLVNGVDLEDYVYSVLQSEGFPGWPLEVNKLLAITFRSYVVAKFTEARGKQKLGKGFLYDVCSTNRHQTYRGVHKNTALREAVDATRGVVLSFKKRPALAMYDTCCGGVVPAHIHTVNSKAAPYLARSYPCTYCASCSAYSWQAVYSPKEIEKVISAGEQKIKAVQKVHVEAVDKAGLVKTLCIKSKGSSTRLSGGRAYSLFKDIKSLCFSVTRKSGSIVFTGRGRGHLRGLCQWGAREMIRQGYSCTEVLHFYYPGTSLMRLEVIPASGSRS